LLEFDVLNFPVLWLFDVAKGGEKLKNLEIKRA